MGFCITAFVLASSVRECRGAERIYFVMFLSGLLIEPLRLLPFAVSMVALSAQTGAALVMLFASLWLLFTINPRSEDIEPHLPS